MSCKCQAYAAIELTPHRDSDIERVKTAESESSELRGRLYQLEQILRAVEKEKSEQTEMIR